MKIKVLVVEDNKSLSRAIIDMLTKEGYDAFGSTDMKSAKKFFLKESPHIVLLDIMLPDSNGYDLIPFFRKRGDSIIIMLTALSDNEIKKISYENGADDYIIKPFDLYELIYKLKAIKRRIISQLKIYEIGDITFNAELNILSCNDKSIKIQPSQGKLLKALYEKYKIDTFLDKKDAIDWYSSSVDESFRLQTIVARLRKNLSGIGSDKVIIENVYGKGYRLVILKG